MPSSWQLVMPWVPPSPWQARYCIDAMLEHAVMHAIRHTFQLEELMRPR